MEKDSIPGSLEEPAPENLEGAVLVPWYASVWFNLLMISLSMCFCSVTAFYPIVALKKNERITERQKSFIVMLGIIVGILSLFATLLTLVLLVLGVFLGIKRFGIP